MSAADATEWGNNTEETVLRCWEISILCESRSSPMLTPVCAKQRSLWTAWTEMPVSIIRSLKLTRRREINRQGRQITRKCNCGWRMTTGIRSPWQDVQGKRRSTREAGRDQGGLPCGARCSCEAKMVKHLAIFPRWLSPSGDLLRKPGHLKNTQEPRCRVGLTRCEAESQVASLPAFGIQIFGAT